MKKVYAGLEYGSTNLRLYGLDEDGKKVKETPIPLTDSRQENQKRLRGVVEPIEGEVYLHHEECEMDGFLLDTLSPLVEQVYASDPLQNTWIARDPDKNDKLDARKLAELLRMDTFRRVYVSGCKKRRQFRRIVSHRQQLVKKEVRMLNQIKAEFRQEGIVIKATTEWPQQKREKYLDQVPQMIESILRQKFNLLATIRDNRRKAEKLMNAAAKSFPEVEKLKEAPGVGDVTGCRFIARIQNPHRFDNKRALIRYCSLAVVNQASDGSPLGYERLNQDGCSDLKDVSNTIFRCSKRTTDWNGFKQFYRNSLERTGDGTKARLNTQRKIVVCLWTIWKKDIDYRDEEVFE